MQIFDWVLCFVQDVLASIFGFLNATIGDWFGFELEYLDLGCDR